MFRTILNSLIKGYLRMNWEFLIVVVGVFTSLIIQFIYNYLMFLHGLITEKCRTLGVYFSNQKMHILKSSKTLRNLLILLHFLLSIGAIFGGISLILQPDGTLLGMPVEILEPSLFYDFLIPGFILLLTFGLFPIYLVFALLKKPQNRFFERLNLLYDHHFAWTFTIYTGVALMIWINVQTAIFKTVDPLHTIYFFYGLVLVCLALLPKTRELYKK